MANGGQSLFSAKVIVPLLVATVGILLLAYAAWSFYKQFSFVENAVSATGVVVDYHRTTGTETDTRTGLKKVTGTVPIIEFTTVSGEIVRFISKSNDNVEDNSAVPLLYLESAPELAQINLFFSIWGWIYILGGFGAVLILISLALRVMI